MLRKTVSVIYTAAGKTIEVHNVQIGSLLDIFVPIKISTLSELKFANSKLTAEELEMICPLIPQNLALLDLSNLSLNAKAISVLAKRINYSHIQSLDLSNNPIGDESIWILLEAIGKNQDLTSLILVNCNLSGNGIWTLFNVIAEKKFDFLDISENLIMSNGSDYVLNFLKQDPDIRELHIDRAQLSEGDVDVLVDAAEKSRKLQVFSVRGNSLIRYRTFSPKILVDRLPIMK
ncbi:hypothetical protein TRFO_19880 [Tritrichomonas foetus]|uniref:Leucine Rich Repeat family protein n=1 Tax=Tritrichomonas foetus TaxID=1144522 RepID=A0A1J4KHR0_9EUKA|nr:hypothetical protein TRFO_19880 [Tritrichomonas foetus]|eukprot:OHT10747.1 hypothetical protein TRFO_19880 [Tritrichomonas foetus]